MDNNNLKWPKWAREISKFTGVKTQFILWGNIYDIYPYPLDGQKFKLKNLQKYIADMIQLCGNYELILTYDTIDGFELIKGNIELVNSLTGLNLDETRKKLIKIGDVTTYIENYLLNKQYPVALFYNYSSRYTQNPKELTDEEEFPFFSKMLKLAYQIKPCMKNDRSSSTPDLNSIFWFVDKINDLPAWLTLNNPTLKVIVIPKPDNEIREQIILQLVQGFPDFKLIEGKKSEKLIKIFRDQTEKMFTKDLKAIVQFMLKGNIRFIKIGDAIRSYKLGISENRWEKLGRKKILNGANELKRSIKGQDHAINQTLDIIKRSKIGISGAQWAKFSNKPRGILFLAGPTGVGKTELAKTITRVVFGSEKNYIRFDMSEFNHEHADQRLIGAPPGYVGYEVGGELTNAIKQNPFSVILFDEIEKAHVRILDKFLQILEDGRLTDGRGDTVYFSEALIIFTSNLGVYEENKETGERIPLISTKDDYEKVKSKILDKIEKFFKFEIHRPEILNRLGKNIIVFDFIREPAAHEIFKKMIGNVLNTLWENKKIKIEIPEEISNQILNECIKDLTMGGRGIGNKLEEIFVNPLSRVLFDDGVKEKSTYIIKKLFYDNQIWNISGNSK